MIRLILCVFLMVFLGSCSKKTTVILLPDPHGSVGKVYVEPKDGQNNGTLLEQANESIVTYYSNPSKSGKKIIDPEKLPDNLQKILTNEPQYLLSYRFYFNSDSTKLQENSRGNLDMAIETIKERQSCDIVSIGHTDSVGDAEYNIKLSTERADAVKDLLVQAGIASECILTMSYGEWDPLVITGDDVPERVNRRVELEIR